MYLLYVDESGSPQDPNQQYFVLAGVAVFERKTHWLEQALDNLASRIDPNEPEKWELHGSPMRNGNKEWRRFPKEQRQDWIKEGLKICADAKQTPLFAAVVKRERAAVDGIDPVIFCFEQLASRFDMFLGRRYNNGDPQRGLMLFDESSTEQRLQALARTFKHQGHRFGKLHNFAEVPVFLDSKATRLIQLADLIAFAIFRHYEAQDSQYFDIIRHCFDQEGGVIHGLKVLE
jgi:Protein of unknown function (DUF3800)